MKVRFRHLKKWITGITIFLIMIGISKDICIGYGEYLPFYELVLVQLNSTHSLLFVVTFVVMLFSATNEKTIDYIIPSKIAFVYLRQAIASALLVVFMLIAASLTYALFNIGFERALTNEWMYAHYFSVTGESPAGCLLIAVLLFGLRCTFLFFLISLINVLTSRPYWGFWSVLCICFIDFRFYNQTHIPYPLNILPVEHTRILYTEAFHSPMSTVTRISYSASIIYWIILLLIVYEIIKFTYRKRGRQHEKDICTRNQASI